MGSRINYEIGHPAAAILFSNSSHEFEDPELIFRSLVAEYVGRPTGLVAALLALTYKTDSSKHQAGQAVFSIDLYQGDRDFVLVADIESGTVSRREGAPFGLATLPNAFEAAVLAQNAKRRHGLAADLYTTTRSVRFSLWQMGQNLHKSLVDQKSIETIASQAAALNLTLVDFLGRRGVGLQAVAFELYSERQALLSAPGAIAGGECKRLMPGTQISFNEEEFGVVARDDGETLLVVVEEGCVVQWQREIDGISIKVETHYIPCPDEMERHCFHGVNYRGFTCEYFGDGRAEFSKDEQRAGIIVPLGVGWELEAWAAAKVEIDRSYMH